jgi:putative ABC transport system permease protein
MTMKLLLNLVRKDFRRNPVITAALAATLLLSALLLAGGLRMTGTMLAAVNGLAEAAQPPDYIQMHKGDYDAATVANFVKTHDDMAAAETVRMLDLRNTALVYQGETLEKCLMDNSLVVQNQQFDYLLDQNNHIAAVAEGEIGVPVFYAQTLGIKVGDVITLQQGEYRKALRVATLIRDATMNSALASSKRFLVSPADLEAISCQMGEWEYCFEFRLADGAEPAVLAQDYRAVGLPANGVGITGSVLTLLNSLSYGLTAFVIVAISLLLIFIALLCLSYIIRATLAEEQATIGEMKAIGLPVRAIGNLYQLKYCLLMLAATVSGYLLGIPCGDFLAQTVVRYCGEGQTGWLKWLLPAGGLVLLYLMVLFGCTRIIRRQLKRTVGQLRRGEEKIRREGHYALPLAGLKQHNLTLAVGETKCKWRENIVIFFVFVFAAFLILLPNNIRQTVKNPSFITYMGVGQSDIRIDIQYTGNRVAQKNMIGDYLKNDPDITRLAVFENAYVTTQNAAGESEELRVESGDETVFPLNYLEGHAPVGKTDMALSYLNAVALGKAVGDPITVDHHGEPLTFTVSGIYQDITYGGKTAKAAIAFDDQEVEVYILYLNVAAGISVADKTAALRQALPGAKITPIQDFVAQTLSGIIDDLGLVEAAAVVIALLLSVLITVMYLSLLTVRERGEIAIKQALGFTSRDIRLQYGLRLLLIQVPAIVLGTLLANGLGGMLFGCLLSAMGAARITLLVAPLTAYLLCPAVQLLVVLLTVLLSSRAVGSGSIRALIRE